MPDFKFAEPGLARYCMGDSAYPEIALAALREMFKSKGFLRPFDTDGETVAEKGVLVRHLVLPGQVANSISVLEILHREFGPCLPLSVMSQYRPIPACQERGNFARELLREEYDAVCERVEELGFENVYVQELSPETKFLPDFNAKSPFPGNQNSHK